MFYLGLPVGSNYGWGVMGKHIALEMAQLADVRLLLPVPELGLPCNLNDEIDAYRLRQLMLGPDDEQYLVDNTWRLPGPVIQGAFGGGIDPFVPRIEPPYRVGFVVFEDTELPPEVVERTKRRFERLAAGSSYCAEILERHGFQNVSTVMHGVNTSDFCPRTQPREFLTDKFVIFSGGKFELRKGQDIVIRAYKVLQDRHADVFLINSWFNMWPAHRDTMQVSPLIQYHPPTGNDYYAWMNGLLAANGLDLERVLTVEPRDNRLLASLYHATDLGLFPNRVEGGNNMPLMEYMACGKPVVASYNSGHKDVVNRECAVLIERHQDLHVVQGASGRRTVWSDPDLDETIGKLEWCYQNRNQLPALGRRAAEDMKQFSWKRVARSLLDCAQHEP